MMQESYAQLEQKLKAANLEAQQTRIRCDEAEERKRKVSLRLKRVITFLVLYVYLFHFCTYVFLLVYKSISFLMVSQVEIECDVLKTQCKSLTDQIRSLLNEQTCALLRRPLLERVSVAPGIGSFFFLYIFLNLVYNCFGRKETLLPCSKTLAHRIYKLCVRVLFWLSSSLLF